MNETWQPVEDFIATSMGYFALSDGRNGNRINIYHGAKSPAKRIAYNLSYGEVYKGGRVFVPLDGTAQVELKNAPQTINHELVQYYIGQDYLERIDEALYNAESLSESIQALGRINLQKCMALKIDVDVQRSLINYVNSILDIQQNPLYEISGASFIEYAHSEEHQEVYRVNPRAAVIGNIVGIGIDEDAGRFRLVATVPFGDNLTHTIAYRINKKLTVRKMPAYNLSTTARLTVS